MQFVKASERLPELDTILCLKFKGFYCSGQFNSRYGRMECDIAWRGTYLEASFGLIEWLDETEPTPPASAVEEAATMYNPGTCSLLFDKKVAEAMQEAHITCAGMYTGEIEKQAARIKELEDHLKEIYEMYGDEWTNYAQEWTEKVLRIKQST